MSAEPGAADWWPQNGFPVRAGCSASTPVGAAALLGLIVSDEHRDTLRWLLLRQDPAMRTGDDGSVTYIWASDDALMGVWASVEGKSEARCVLRLPYRPGSCRCGAGCACRTAMRADEQRR